MAEIPLRTLLEQCPFCGNDTDTDYAVHSARHARCLDDECGATLDRYEVETNIGVNVSAIWNRDKRIFAVDIIKLGCIESIRREQ